MLESCKNDGVSDSLLLLSQKAAKLRGLFQPYIQPAENQGPSNKSFLHDDRGHMSSYIFFPTLHELKLSRPACSLQWSTGFAHVKHC